jgi:hypothetical protein
MIKIKTIKASKKRVSKRLKRFLLNNHMKKIYEALRQGEDSKNYFDFSSTDGSKISYLKGSRIPDKSHLLFDKPYRLKYGYHTSIGKILSGSPLVTNDDIIWASKKFFQRRTNFQVEVTTEICKHYLEKNYSKEIQGGSLYSSCMRYAECESYIRAYEIFGSDIVKLAVILDDKGGVLARALLWQDVKNFKGGTGKYLDRVYAVNDNIESVMYSWAEAQGFRTYNQSTGGLSVSVEIDDDTPLPYFDTFQHYQDGVLNTCDGTCLDSTSGYSLREVDGYICDRCGDRVNGDDIHWSDYERQYLCNDCGTYSDYIDDYIAESNACYSNYKDVYFPSGHEDWVYSDYEEDWVLLDDTVYTESGEYIFCDHARYDDETDGYYTIDEYDDLIAERKEAEELEEAEEDEAEEEALV